MRWRGSSCKCRMDGAGRGVIYTKGDYGNFRLVFKMRHVSGQPDHQACILIFCSRPPEGEKGRDALAGIQLQVPNGWSWQRCDLHERRLRKLPAGFQDATCFRTTGPPGLHPNFLQPTTGRRKGTRCAGGDPVASAEWMELAEV